MDGASIPAIIRSYIAERTTGNIRKDTFYSSDMNDLGNLRAIIVYLQIQIGGPG